MNDSWFHLVTEHAIELIGLTDLDGRMIHSSPSCARFLGRDPSFELANVHPDDLERSREWWRHIVAGGDERLEYRLRSAKGEWHWFDACAVVVPYVGRPHVLISSRDITEEKRAEDERALLRTLLDHSNDAIEVIDPETGRFLDVNEAACHAHGYTRAEYLSLCVADISPLVAERTWPVVREESRRVGSRIFESVHRRKDGSTFPVEISLTFVRDDRGEHILTIVRDITERKRAEEDLRRMEEQFRHAQKMEAVGRLAGGVAHDFNNLLTVIQGNTELVMEHLGEGHPVHDALAEVREAGTRATELTHHLLAFCRKQVLLPRVVDLDQLLLGLLQLLRRVIGEDVHVELVRGAHAARVLVDPGQFEHALLNLAVNARDAMPNGGRLKIETREERGEVFVALSDTGHGMDATTQSRIFEPFFTTKEPGRGTGLGLAMVHGFVEQSGGHIDVQSEQGRGTTFTIRLPCTASSPAVTERVEPDDGRSGSETVLVVEDEEVVRRLTRRILLERGYVVLDASGGDEALSLARNYPASIDLLVTDLVMPGMTGSEVAGALTRERPDLRVLLMSGYSDAPVDHGAHFLQKPFGPKELARKVREVLDRSA